MKNIQSLLLALLLGTISFLSTAQVVSLPEAEKAAGNWLSSVSNSHTAGPAISLEDGQGNRLAYCFSLEPQGYLIMGARWSFPPVKAYSLGNPCQDPGSVSNPLFDLIREDLSILMENEDILPVKLLENNKLAWEKLLEGSFLKNSFEQWPPAGSTSTGGWLETNWKQSSPYNAFCPMDDINGQRSVAGCPAIALAMIIHYQKTLNSSRFNDTDAYFHNYAGRQYWIDDDHQSLDFLSFPRMNEYFDSVEQKFQNYTPLTDDEIAALVFACGVAARQVYTSEVSGTFGVDQAYDAYMRFGFQGAELIYDSDTSFYTRMKNNMKDGIPVHLALLVNGAGGGHNVVTDGYNTDDYYHLNFGWGGSYNGWYLIPEEIPYNLTIVEGAIMDIGTTHVGLTESPKENESFRIYPNPSAGKVHCSFELETPAEVKLSVFSPEGRLITKIYEGVLNNGIHTMDWDAAVNAGIYTIVLQAGNKPLSRKLIITDN